MLDTYIRLTALTVLLGVCRATIYRWMEQGTFPRPYKLGARSVAWKRSSIEAWMESRQESKGGAA